MYLCLERLLINVGISPDLLLPKRMSRSMVDDSSPGASCGTRPIEPLHVLLTSCPADSWLSELSLSYEVHTSEQCCQSILPAVTVTLMVTDFNSTPR